MHRVAIRYTLLTIIHYPLFTIFAPTVGIPVAPLNRLLHRILWLIGLVLVQALILNNVHIAGYATPFLYIYLVMKMESGAARNELMLWAFFIGLAVDIFSDTPGMNAAATVLLAFVRPYLLNPFVSRDTVESVTPSFDTVGVAPFMRYTALCVVTHHTVLLAIEFFSLAHLPTLALRIVCGAALTVACVAALEVMTRKR